MNEIKLKCDWCGDSFFKETKEIKRKLKLGKKYFFCSLSCGAKFNNEISGRKAKEIEMTCKCGKVFKTYSRKKSKKHCSRECASKYSVTKKRREACILTGLNSKKNLLHDIKTISLGLKNREYWKYVKLKEFLIFQKEDFEFEIPIGNYVFDLALKCKKILIEFDGRYHNFSTQQSNDLKKTKRAESEGWKVIRIKTEVNTVLDPSILYNVLNNAR